MHTFKYDDNGDWILNEMVYGDEQIVQNLKHLFRQRVTEWMFNEYQGFRHEDTWNKAVERRRIVQAVYDCAYQEPKVKEVMEVDYEHDKIKRTLKIWFKARKQDSSKIEVNLIVNNNRI